ncbi:MAG: GAF domain-containing protein, partial [Ignavibacteria bacterium]|nr:GAF domain-containing protein [Ignavibacteria bacterium]
MLGNLKEDLIGKEMHANHHHHKPDGSEYPREECPIYYAFKDGSTHTVTNEVFWRKDGTPFFVEYTSTPIYKEGKINGAVVVFKDITERKLAEQQLIQSAKRIERLNRVYVVLSNVNQLIVRERNEQKLFEEACRIAVNDGKFRMALIGLVDEENAKVNFVAKDGYANNYFDRINIDLKDKMRNDGPTGTAIKTQKHFIINNIDTDERMKPWREAALNNNYRSCASFPLNVFGKVYGAFTLFSDSSDFFDEEEIKLLDEMAMDISFAIETGVVENQKIVAEENLRESELRFRSVWEKGTDGMRITNEEGNVVLVNDAYCKMVEKPLEEIEGK